MKSKHRLVIIAFLTILSAGLTATAQAIPKDLLITLKRTQCYGTCPAYTLMIDHRGVVSFNGEANTKVKGGAVGKLTAAKLKVLLKRFDDAKFDSLKDSYNDEEYCGPMITDMPSETLSLTASGKTKKVDHYFGCRGKGIGDELKRLSDLGHFIDEITGSKRWVGK